MKKWFLIAAAIAIVVVGSIAVWQVSGDDARRAGAVEVSDEPVLLSWRGEWSDRNTYGPGQVVTVKGSAFVAEREPGESAPDPWCEEDCRPPDAWCPEDCRWAFLAHSRRAGAVEVSDEPVPLSWRGEWSERNTYGPGQVVTVKGSAFVAERESGESAPDPWCEEDCRPPDAWCPEDCRWAFLAHSRRAGTVEVSDEPVPLSWRGEWSERNTYGPGQVVTVKGSAFVAEREPGESAPDPWCEDDCRWALLAD